MKDIQLYGFPGSTYLRTVQMVCEHKGITYSQKPLEFREKSHEALHPFLRMPVLKSNDFILFESLAICSYLEDIQPENPVIPKEGKLKYFTLQWVSAFIDYLAPVLIKGKPENEGQEWPAVTEKYLKILDQNIAKYGFLAGEQPTLADMYLSPAIGYALGGPGFEELFSRHDALCKWWEIASGCETFEKTGI